MLLLGLLYLYGNYCGYSRNNVMSFYAFASFAGLKILRCCNTCDIVGSIKGTKEFKGAHWHCYRCKNGFNRRDEALKHYKTHFRNPQTTFQIQICQVKGIGKRIACKSNHWYCYSCMPNFNQRDGLGRQYN